MEYEKKAKKTFSRIGIAYTVFLLGSFVIQAAVMMAMMFLERLELMPAISSSVYLFIATLPMYLAGVPICFLILKDMPTPCRPQKQDFSAKKLLVCFVIAVSVMYLGNIIGSVLMGAVNMIRGGSFSNPVDEMVRNMDTEMIFLLMVVIAPVAEEFLFRKVLIDRTRQYGDKAAILLSGVVFGLSHGNFYQFFYAFGLGILFAFIYINSGKLRYTILLHGVINFMGSVLALFVEKNIYFQGAYILFLLLMMVLGLVFLIAGRKKAIFRAGPEELASKGRFSVLFLNFGMLLFFGTSCVTFLLI